MQVTPGKSSWPIKPSWSTKGKRPIYVIGVDTIKEIVFARLAKAEAGPGYCHTPITRDHAWFAEMTAEKPYTKYTKGRAVREWRKKASDRNEAFDCRVYSYAALESLKYGGFDLDVETRRIADLVIRPVPSAHSTPRSGVIRSDFMNGRGQR